MEVVTRQINYDTTRVKVVSYQACRLDKRY
jgi:hypothetical protein